MSLTIVPLAGPDFYTARFGIRPLYPVGGRTLIEHVLGSRAWLRDGASDTLVFVLREEGAHTATMRAFLAQRYPQAAVVVLDRLSAGAPLSALAGVALAQQPDTPLLIDLADIAFTLAWDPAQYFAAHPQVDAVVPYFESDDAKFSYLTLDGPRVLMAREKHVISSHASAGVYAFRDVASYLRALAYCVQHPHICRVGAALFVCPAVNGLITGTREVHALPVGQVEPVSALFHAS
jgi:CTP:molybdopterin cytidylyltransferase MocA